MRYKPLIISAVLSALIILCTLIVSYSTAKPENKEAAGIAVAANEVNNLLRSGDTAAASEKTKELIAAAQSVSAEKDSRSAPGLWIVCAAAVIVVNVCVIYVWRGMVRPFHKLEGYAEKLAAGEFDAALDYERSNYFGRFTWAFDSMRREIVKARACEKAAIENNKTVIATLSHDLKTPVASISAYSEALVNGLYSSTEEMYSYLDVINRKCEEVAKLTNDMVTHSISELGALRMVPADIELGELLEETVKGSAARDIAFEQPLFKAWVSADRNRLAQLFGNLIGNAQKYAGTKIDVSISRRDRFFDIRVRDYGSGIPNEDMPFVFDKFYRGGNTADINGSGLGLYIVKYIAEQSGGEVQLRNAEPGLEVTVTLPEKAF